MKLRIMAAVLVATLLGVTLTCFAASFQAEEKSKYRTIDMTGTSINPSYAKFVMPDVGVGITIFSTNPLPHNKDEQYNNVKTDFSIDEINKAGLYARDFLPGRTGELIKYIESKNSGYKFVKKYTRFELFAADGKYEKMDAEDRLNAATMTWSTRLSEFHPNNIYPRFPVVRAMQKKPGKHSLVMSTYLVFTTGETKVVSEWQGSQLITQRVPIFNEVLIGHGKVTITN